MVLLVVPSFAQAKGPQLQYLDGYLTNDKGRKQDLFHPSDKGVYIYLFFKNLKLDEAHEHRLKIQAIAPDGKPYGRPLGGTMHVGAGEVTDDRDFPRTIDSTGHNGYVISGEKMSAMSGQYMMVIEVDGRKVGEIPFRIVTGARELELSSTFLANSEGKLKEEFAPSDRAVFLYAFFRNLDPTRQHGHRVRATFYGPGGKQHGRILGGDFQVKAGADLTRVDFPRSADPQQHNGFYIEQSLDQSEAGEYRIVLELDGKVVKEVRYRLTGGGAAGTGGGPAGGGRSSN